MDMAQLLDLARQHVGEIGPEEMLDGDVVVDVREPHELAAGMIPGSIHIPQGSLLEEIGNIETANQRVVLYCATGVRSLVAGMALSKAGYADVVSLEGGIKGWAMSGRELSGDSGLTTQQRNRYERHLTLAEVGEKGQQTLLGSRVTVVGAGGLGSPALLYLAAAGVGTLRIVDDDAVDITNLQRQIIHDVRSLGTPKTDSAADRIAALNPDVTVEVGAHRLAAANVEQLVAGSDVIVDGADNFPTRYLLNDVSLRLGIPVVHGSIFRFEGQASVFTPMDGPCYRCLFPEPPPPHLAPSCAEAGVLGILPGIIGSIQATEAIKLLLGIGEPLVGRLLTYDALEQSFRELRFDRDPDCLACGRTEPPALIDYDETCRP